MHTCTIIITPNNIFLPFVINNIHLPSVIPESTCSGDVICSQKCVRLFGVDVCSCNLGYMLDRDNVTCSGEELLSSAC